MGFSGTGKFGDTLDSAIIGVVTVGTSSVEAKVGGSPVPGRQMLRIFNESSNTIYFGYDSGVTTSGSTRGEKLLKNQSVTMMLTSGQSVYLIAGSAGNEVLVTEFA